MPGVERSFLTLSGVQDPSVSEFIAHPDFRQISTFFLGWTFFCSLRHLTRSPLARRLLDFACNAFLPARKRRVSVSGSQQTGIFRSDEKRNNVDNASLFSVSDVDYSTLTFTLTLTFMLASIAQFGTLLTFSNNNGDIACAFLVAWGGMASSSAQLIGLLLLSFKLKQLGTPRWEVYLFWAWLAVGVVLIFVTNAISIGVRRPVSDLGISLCYRKHFIPTSLFQSLVHIMLDVYCFIRFVSRLAPSFYQLPNKLDILLDLRVMQSGSLILFNLLAIAPDAVFFNTVADFVPSAVGSILVISAFNMSTLKDASRGPFIHAASPISRWGAGTVSTDNLQSSPSRAVAHASWPVIGHRPRLLPTASGRGPLLPVVMPIPPNIPNHPYALDIHDERSPLDSDRRSSTSSELAKSLKDATIQYVTRAGKGKTLPPPLPVLPPRTLDRGTDTRWLTPASAPQLSLQIIASPLALEETFQKAQSGDQQGGPAQTKRLSARTQSTYSKDRPLTIGSAIYGSDIVHHHASAPRDATKKVRAHQSLVTIASRRSYPSAESESHGTSSKRYSIASIWRPTSEEIISPLHRNGTRRFSVFGLQRPTFGPEEFERAGYLPKALPAMPTTPSASLFPGRAVAGKLMGPRPIPGSPRRAPANVTDVQ